LDKIVDSAKAKCREVKEIILALGATRDSEMTESFLKDLIAKEFPKIQVTRLAQGIPVGSELKYVDKETLKQSLTFRQRL
jgi:recombination protein RecR